MRITVVAPRKDLGDEHRNAIQDAQRNLLPGVPYITATYDHVGDPDLWSMSRAVNAGVQQATTPGLLITPADYLISPAHIAAAESALDVHPWLGVFASVFVLTHEATQRTLKTGNVDMGRGKQLNCCVPCIAVRADVFADVGGMEPRFAGWGPEDVAFRAKLQVLYGPPGPTLGETVELAAPGTGVWGPNGYDGPTPNRRANDLLANRYMNATSPAAMRALIDESAP